MMIGGRDRGSPIFHLKWLIARSTYYNASENEEVYKVQMKFQVLVTQIRIKT